MSLVVVAVFPLLSISLGVPLQPYNPQTFYATSERIIGGVEAPKGFAPHMVALVVGENMASLMCGGSMVSQGCVVTAAHCIDPLLDRFGELLPSVRGVVGTNTWSDERKTHRFSGHRNHPQWDRFLIKNDVGVLFLAEALQPSELVGVVPLNFDWVGGGERIYVTGWGRSTWLRQSLQLLYVDTLSPAECEAGLREAQAALGASPAVDPAVELCTRHERGAGQGMCFGDSGSALVDRKYRQVGLVSWGFPCALGHPDVHARISGLRDFLEEALNGTRNGELDNRDD